MQQHRKNQDIVIFPVSCNGKKNFCHRPFRRMKNRLHFEMPTGYNSHDPEGVYCIQSIAILDTLLHAVVRIHPDPLLRRVRATYSRREAAP